jgi:radical SAM protein with 4Fe4S-binding SPASM domain
MSVGMAKKLLDEMADHLPVALVPFFRGESLLHAHWIEILSHAKKKGLGPIQFTTNATLMDQRASEAILEVGIDFISFSVDTIDPVVYERTRRGAVYEKVLRNILYLVELREKRGVRLPEIQVSAVETALHQEGMDAFVHFWRNRVDRVRIYVEHSRDGRSGSIAGSLPSFDARKPCKKAFEDMVIYWDGEVALCNHDWTRSASTRIGTVRESRLGDVWKSRQYHEVRTAHLKGDLSGRPPCDHCDHWKMFHLPEGLIGRCYGGTRRAVSHSR